MKLSSRSANRKARSEQFGWEGDTLVVDTTNFNGKGMIATRTRVSCFPASAISPSHSRSKHRLPNRSGD
jgi:hypothetical protein